MNPNNTVSDDVRRMAREDAIFGKAEPSLRKELEENPEMNALLEREFADFEKRFQIAARGYGEEGAYDAYMEESIDFWAELADKIAKWIKGLPNDTVFQRGCSHALKQLKLLFDRIEALRPPEPL